MKKYLIQIAKTHVYRFMQTTVVNYTKKTILLSCQNKKKAVENLANRIKQSATTATQKGDFY